MNNEHCAQKALARGIITTGFSSVVRFLEDAPYCGEPAPRFGIMTRYLTAGRIGISPSLSEATMETRLSDLSLI